AKTSRSPNSRQARNRRRSEAGGRFIKRKVPRRDDLRGTNRLRMNCRSGAPAAKRQGRDGQAEQRQRGRLGDDRGDGDVVEVHLRVSAIAVDDQAEPQEGLPEKARIERAILLRKRLGDGPGEDLAAGELGAV